MQLKAEGMMLVFRELRYVLEDAQVSVVLSTPGYESQIAPLAHKVGAGFHRLDSEVSCMSE